MVRSEPQPGPGTHDKTRVLVVDDHRTFADLLSLALSHEPDLECVGLAHSVEEGVALALHLRPDAVVMDVHVGEGDGVTATAALTEADNTVRVIVLTAYATQSLLLRAAEAGACCLLPKDGALSELLTALRSAPRDGFAVHPTLLKRLISSPGELRPHVTDLTRREHEVLAMLSEGMDARAIARTLGISLNTCRGYVRSLLQKLDAHSQLEAVATAKKLGLIA